MGNARAARTTPNTAELSRRERRRHEVRSRIVAAAVRLFDEKGFAATTVAEICDRADVADKTFFNYFASKRHMLREVARVELDVLLALIDAARRRPGSRRERLEHFFRLLADRIDAAGPMRRELLTELVHIAHEAGTEAEQARTLHAAFASILRAGHRAGNLTRAHGIDTLTDVVLGAFYALMFNWASIEGYPFRKRALAVARFLTQAIT